MNAIFIISYCLKNIPYNFKHSKYVRGGFNKKSVGKQTLIPKVDIQIVHTFKKLSKTKNLTPLSIPKSPPTKNDFLLEKFGHIATF